MPEDITNVEKDALNDEEIVAVVEKIVENEGFLKRVGKMFKFGEEDVDNPPDSDSDEDVDEGEDVVAELRKEYSDKIVELQKQTDSLADKLGEAQADADEQREKRALQAEIEKAQSYVAVPGELEEIAKLAHYLRANNEELAEWFDGYMVTVDKQLEEAKLYDEFGSSVVEEKPEGIVAKAQEVAEGDADKFKEELLKTSREEQEQYIKDRRNKARRSE